MMGKRSDFPRIERDSYDTPPEAVAPLVPHLPNLTTFCEPCAGAGQLTDALQDFGLCVVNEFDIQPRAEGMLRKDALSISEDDVFGAELIITNPPWARDILHPMIEAFSDLRPTWLLFDADWMHTKQSAPYMDRLRMVVSVGRLKWIKDSPHTGKDNCCWYLFSRALPTPPVFVGRLV